MKKYIKALIGKYNPDNFCFSKDGELLVIATKNDKVKRQLRKGEHFFIGTETGEPAQYGWVKNLTEPISPEGLASLRWSNPSVEQIDICEMLLEAVSKESQGTPMACHFIEVVGPEGKRSSVMIHKVIFYGEK